MVVTKCLRKKEGMIYLAYNFKGFSPQLAGSIALGIRQGRGRDGAELLISWQQEIEREREDGARDKI
jgi:hypothetical protein